MTSITADLLLRHWINREMKDCRRLSRDWLVKKWIASYFLICPWIVLKWSREAMLECLICYGKLRTYIVLSAQAGKIYLKLPSPSFNSCKTFRVHIWVTAYQNVCSPSLIQFPSFSLWNNCNEINAISWPHKVLGKAWRAQSPHPMRIGDLSLFSEEGTYTCQQVFEELQACHGAELF